MVNVNKLVQMAIKKAGEVAGATEFITYVKVMDAVYDPVSGSTINAVQTYPEIEVVLTDMSEFEQRMFGVVDKDTQKMVLAANDLPVRPRKDDYVMDETGQRWEVVRVKATPGRAAYIVYLQA